MHFTSYSNKVARPSIKGPKVCTGCRFSLYQAKERPMHRLQQHGKKSLPLNRILPARTTVEDDSGDVPPTPLKLKCLPRRYARVASPPRCASPKYGGNRRHHHRRKYGNVSNISKEKSINSKSIHAENIAWYVDISRYDTEN